jgi:hypothetical protein
MDARAERGPPRLCAGPAAGSDPRNEPKCDTDTHSEYGDSWGSMRSGILESRGIVVWRCG